MTTESRTRAETTRALGLVPFADLRLQHAQVADEVRVGIDRVLAHGAYVLGPEVGAFEEEFAAFSGVRHCIGVANGTDAVELALRGVGIGPGDEVVVPTNTFVATVEAIARSGARAVLVDCDDDFLVDVEGVTAALGPRTRAVVGVHLYGQMAPLDQLRAALPADVLLIEDAAQSQGAEQHGVRSGSGGVVAATSFYPGKNLGAYGDAGAVMTDSDEVAERIRQLRNHGGTRRYEHESIGMNSRLDAMQAVVLSAKLKHLQRWNAERRAAASVYEDLLGGVAAVRLPRVVPGNEHVWHLYVVRVDDRDHVAACMQAAGVEVGIHYPRPIHALPAFEPVIEARGSLARADRSASETLSLPMFPGITPEQQVRVADALRDALAGTGPG